MILHVLILVRLTSLQNLVSTLPVFHVCMFLKFLPSLGKLHNCKATLQGKDLLCTTLYSCYTRAKGTHPSHLRNAWLKESMTSIWGHNCLGNIWGRLTDMLIVNGSSHLNCGICTDGVWESRCIYPGTMRLLRARYILGSILEFLMSLRIQFALGHNIRRPTGKLEFLWSQCTFPAYSHEALDTKVHPSNQ